MIGMMNSGNSNDVPVEFYSSPQRSSMYEARRHREKLSYTEDGRILLDGNLKFQKNANDLWQETLMRMICNKVRNVERGRSKKSKLYRLFEQFSIHSSGPEPPTITIANESEVEKHAKCVQHSVTSQQSSPTISYSSTSTTNTAPYVTTIIIRPNDAGD